MSDAPLQRIPISKASSIAKQYGYDQVIIYARIVGTPGGEWVTTYGRDKTHCAAAARIGDAIGRQVVTPIEERDARIATLQAENTAYKLALGDAYPEVRHGL